MDPRQRQVNLREADLRTLQGFIYRQGDSGGAAGGGGPGGHPVGRFRIVDLDVAVDSEGFHDPAHNGDYLLCRTWDGTTEGGSIRARAQSPERAIIASGGLLTRDGSDWVALGVLTTDVVEITDAKENGDPVPEANGVYTITTVTPSTITLTGWTPTGTINADFKVGTNTVLIAKPYLLRRSIHDTVAKARAKSLPRGSVTVSALTAAGVNFEDLGVVATDRVQITDASYEDADGATVEVLDDTYDISAVSGGTIDLADWPHGEFVTDCRFRVGAPGARSPRNGIEYLYIDHVTRTAKLIVAEGEDPGARERQKITPDYVVGDEVFAIGGPLRGTGVVEDGDPDTNVAWIQVAQVHAWAQRDTA